jgi:hypothetical protein
MANLWRVLALSWLGGVASPAMLDEAQAMELAQPPAATAPAPARPAGSLEASLDPNRDAPDASRDPTEA